MKKIMVTLASLLFGGTLAVSAQSMDTVPSRKMDTLRQQGGEYKKGTESQTQQGSQNLRDMQKVQATDIPEALRMTLQGSEYKGWDDQTSTIYKNTAGDLYVVEIRDGNKTKTYHFDREGKPIKDY